MRTPRRASRRPTRQPLLCALCRTAASVYGALRGLETFAQLAFGGSAGKLVPSVEIQDVPRFGYRGVMVDTARLFRPVGLLEVMLDAMASAKLNVLYLHLTDDGCWRVGSHPAPALVAKPCPPLQHSSSSSPPMLVRTAELGSCVCARARACARVRVWMRPGHGGRRGCSDVVGVGTNGANGANVCARAAGRSKS